MCLFLSGCLYYNQEVVLIGSDHHLIFLACDTKEGEVVAGVEVTDEVPRLSRQRGELHSVVSGLGALVHGAADEHGLRGAPLLVLSIVHNEETLHSLVLRDPLYSLVHLASLGGCCCCDTCCC
jgi:hypothetical protein